MTTMKARPSSVADILLNEYLKPLAMSSRDLANLMGVPYSRIDDILRHSKNISNREGELLSKIFNTDSDFWRKLQENYINHTCKFHK
ncbi:TPA: HigA family addiction module antitoxin [Escherichia coli]